MTKLTTESLEKFVNDIKTDGMCDITDSQVESALIRLLAYEQAAKNPIGSFHISDGKVEATTDYCRDGEWPVQDGEVLVYAAPVLPKQSELVENLKKVMNNWLAMEPKLAFQPEFTDVMMLLDAEAAPAQPVIPEQQQPIAYIFKHPAGRLFWSLTDESNQGQADVIPVYADPHELKIPPAIEPDYEVIKGILPTANPDEYACCIAADMWNACRAEMLKAQPVSNPYKLKDAVADIRNSGVEIDADKIKAERDAINSPVIPDGWKLVPIEPTAEMAQAARDCHEGESFLPYSIYRAMLAAAPAQESE